MATLIVLKFEDNDDAIEFANNIGSEFVEVIGRYRTPTLFCECTGSGKSWAWEPTHGWVVHASYVRRNENGCMRPSLPWGSSHRAVIGHAINHINPDNRWVQMEYKPTDILSNRGLLK
jgi:hypothetical protein